MKKICVIAVIVCAIRSNAQPMLAVTGLDGNVVHLYSVRGIVPRPVKDVEVGKAPGSMCLDPNGSRIFVSVTGDKRVAIVDLKSQTLAGTLSAPGMQFPDTCAVSPDSKKLYVPDARANLVFVFSLESNQLLKQIATGKEPTRALFAPDGKRLLIANAGSNDLSVIDPATDTVTRTVKTGTEPHAMTFTPDARTLIVTQLIDDSISYFNGDTLEFERSVGVPQAPQSVICSHDGKIAYVLGRITGTLALVKLDAPGDRNRRVGGIVSLPPYSQTMAMRDEGNYMYVTADNANNALVVVDLPMNNVAFTMQVGYVPYGMIYRK